jgi:hypothetical protein
MEVLFGGAGADVVRQVENGEFGLHGGEKQEQGQAEPEPEVKSESKLETTN